MRIRCTGCGRIRVAYVEGFCRACHTRNRPKVEHHTVNGRSRLVDGAWAAKQRGRAKNRGEGGHRWDSASASKAAKKLWATRWRFVSTIGTRIGVPAKRRSRLDYVALRGVYTVTPSKGISYVPAMGQWFQLLSNGHTVPIAERTALRRLGHLPSPHGWVPPGTTPALLPRIRPNHKRRKGTK